MQSDRQQSSAMAAATTPDNRTQHRRRPVTVASHAIVTQTAAAASARSAGPASPYSRLGSNEVQHGQPGARYRENQQPDLERDRATPPRLEPVP